MSEGTTEKEKKEESRVTSPIVESEVPETKNNKGTGSIVDKDKLVFHEFSDEAKIATKKFVHKISHEGLHNLRMQYNDLKAFVPADSSHLASDANPKKCRYKDIVCFDKTRVTLNWPPNVEGDFIHANWVTHELLENKFICTQAPMDNTVGDFWRAVWQEKVKQIIMLCRCVEMGKSKCAQYWPVEVDEIKSMPYGLTLKCVKVDKSNINFIHTRLSLIFEAERRYVDHRQWTSWPDKSVPTTSLAPFRLLQYTRKHTKYPSLIHCSAGVGRTGTMVAIEMMYKSLSKAIVPDPTALLRNLRSQRFLAVQTEDQYVYCHYAIIQFAYAKRIASRHDVKIFCKEYVNYIKLVKDNGDRAPPLNATKPIGDCVICRNAKKGVVEEQEHPSSGDSPSAKERSKIPVTSKRKKKPSPDASNKGGGGSNGRISEIVNSPGKIDDNKVESTDKRKEKKMIGGGGAEKKDELNSDRKKKKKAGASVADSKTKMSISKLSQLRKVSSMPNISLEIPPKIESHESGASSVDKMANAAKLSPATKIKVVPGMSFKNYTIQTAGTGKKIVYQKASKPFIRAAATSKGPVALPPNDDEIKGNRKEK